jgi:N-acetylglucosaminyldiphosphoundecaprenol N-acetyl-beta-D-mannosaminyltransferase
MDAVRRNGTGRATQKREGESPEMTGHEASIRAMCRDDGRHTVTLLGCRIDALTLDETVDRVDRLIAGGGPSQAMLVNADILLQVRDDSRLRAIAAKCNLVSADGQSVVWAARLLGKALPERVAGPDLFDALLALAAAEGYTVYFLGAKPGVAETASHVATAAHPGLRVVGVHHGYFAVDDGSVIDSVRRARPQMLFVGMSSPRKEYWVSENLERLQVPFVLGVGGTFDVVAGVVSRAPLVLQTLGLEWAFRLCQEPRRMWKRYLVGNSRFAALVAREFIGRWRGVVGG